MVRDQSPRTPVVGLNLPPSMDVFVTDPQFGCGEMMSSSRRRLIPASISVRCCSGIESHISSNHSSYGSGLTSRNCPSEPSSRSGIVRTSLQKGIHRQPGGAYQPIHDRFADQLLMKIMRGSCRGTDGERLNRLCLEMHDVVLILNCTANHHKIFI
jgi:hypothetical protein